MTKVKSYMYNVHKRIIGSYRNHKVCKFNLTDILTKLNHKCEFSLFQI